MVMEVRCAGCGARYQVTEVSAGKRFACTKCGAVIAVPSGGTARLGMVPQQQPVMAPAGKSAEAAATRAKEGNTPALVGMILAILSFPIICVGPLLAIAGVILGLVGLGKAKRGAGGKGMAVTAVGLGAGQLVLTLAFVGVVVFAPGVLAVFPPFGRAMEVSNRVKEAAAMRRISQALQIYANENQGKLPPHLAALGPGCLPEVEVLAAPGTGTEPLKAWPSGNWEAIAGDIDAHCDFAYVGADLKNATEPELIVLYSKDKHRGEGRNVLFGDGHVEFVTTARLTDAFHETNKVRAGRMRPAIALDGPAPKAMKPGMPMVPGTETPMGGGGSEAVAPRAPGGAGGRPSIRPLQNVEEAIQALEGGELAEKNRALAFLGRQKVETGRREAVEQAAIAALENEALRLNALRALQVWGSEAAAPGIEKLLAGETAANTNLAVTRAALDALGRIGGAGSAVTVAKYLEVAPTRLVAANNLERMGAGAEEAVIPYLKGGSSRGEMVMADAARVLGRIGTGKSVGPLEEAMGAARSDATKGAIQSALKEIGRREGK